MNCLVPFNTQPLPDFTALVLIAAASEPACGSVRQNAPNISPRAMGFRNRSFCSVEPKASIGAQPTELCTLMIVEQEPSPAATSSIASAYETKSAPAPSHASGTSMPRNPSSPISATAAAGKSPERSQSPALGHSLSRANWRAVSRIRVWSSVSSMDQPASSISGAITVTASARVSR